MLTADHLHPYVRPVRNLVRVLGFDRGKAEESGNEGGPGAEFGNLTSGSSTLTGVRITHLAAHGDTLSNHRPRQHSLCCYNHYVALWLEIGGAFVSTTYSTVRLYLDTPGSSLH